MKINCMDPADEQKDDDDYGCRCLAFIIHSINIQTQFELIKKKTTIV